MTGSMTPGSDRPPIDPQHLSRRLAPCIALYAMATVGGFLGPTLVTKHPALLLMLDSRNRHLLLTVATGLSPQAFFAIGFVRLLLPDPFFYLLGRDYGHRGIGWIERQTQGQTGYLGWVQRWFDKAAPVLIFVMPNIYVCLLAGMDARINPRKMIPIDVAGTVARLALFWWAGKQFETQLKEVLDFIQRYQWTLVAALVAVSVLQSVRQQRRRDDLDVDPAPGPDPAGPSES
jgi:membrane protein DedA with SNARE-associated domain